MPVYLARFGLVGPVKIGCSLNVPARLDQLGARLWEDMKLMRLLDGTMADERALHRRFAAQRIRFEWFHFHPDMLGDLGLPDLARMPALALTPFDEWHRKDPIRVTVSNALRAWMLARGLDERDVAALVNRKPGTVADWLRHGWPPRRDLANRLLALGDDEGLGAAFQQHWDESTKSRRRAALVRKEQKASAA